MPAASIVGCTGLGRVELVVTDLERSRRFYRDVVGLEPVAEGPEGACAFAAGADRLVLRAGSVAGLRLAAWRVTEPSQLDLLAARLEVAGVASVRMPRHDGADELRFVEPATGAAMSFWLPGAGQGRPPPSSTHTSIQRLGHVVFATPQADRAACHAQEWMDFRLSDWIEGGTVFLRPAASPYHHGLGIGWSHRRGLHHLNFMVTELDDIGRAQHRMARLGVPVVFGPGRHPISGSVFLYFLDPDGLTLEYSFGMETFAATGARAPRPWPAEPASVDLWGSPRLAALGARGALLAADTSAVVDG